MLAAPLLHRREFRKYRRGTVRLAGANPKGRWRMKATNRRLRYTTKLSDVPLIT
jgi:hypothetical protein